MNCAWASTVATGADVAVTLVGEEIHDWVAVAVVPLPNTFHRICTLVSMGVWLAPTPFKVDEVVIVVRVGGARPIPVSTRCAATVATLRWKLRRRGKSSQPPPPLAGSRSIRNIESLPERLQPSLASRTSKSKCCYGWPYMVKRQRIVTRQERSG